MKRNAFVAIALLIFAANIFGNCPEPQTIQAKGDTNYIYFEGTDNQGNLWDYFPPQNKQLAQKLSVLQKNFPPGFQFTGTAAKSANSDGQSAAVTCEYGTILLMQIAMHPNVTSDLFNLILSNPNWKSNNIANNYIFHCFVYSNIAADCPFVLS